MSLWSSVHMNQGGGQVEPRGGESWESSRLSSWMLLRLPARSEAGTDFMLSIYLLNTVHLLKKWIVLSGALQRNFCSGLRGLGL